MLTIQRYARDSYGTWGVLLENDKWICHTLEPINADGGKNHALKRGIYEFGLEYSPKFGRVLPTIFARGRSGIRIHEGNIISETRGCPLVGLRRSGTAVLESRAAMQIVQSIAANHNLIAIHEYAFPN